MLANENGKISSGAKNRKPIASLSLDLDNQWSYMKTHGDAGWESFPSYLDVVVPRVLDFLKARNLTITFFIVGQDAALEKNSEALERIAAAGHEIGNHSFHHEPWLHLRSETEIEKELGDAEEHIERVTTKRPIGFRGPGYSFSEDILRVLVRRGYKYDASTFPTYLGPLARAYYFMTTKLSEEEKLKRKELFGKLSDGRRPLKPYRCQVDNGTLIEIPVTTMPVFKLPVHVSYILYLSAFAPRVALSYFRNSMRFCRMTGTQVSLLLHPLDFLGADDGLEALSFFPAMKLPSEKKLRTVSEALSILSGNFSVITLQEHAARLSAEKVKGT
ncbi:MAG TPA: polysaccharide deacetylase family protein [Pyrinomonadaceae bacterium]|nr:polysaccharide deacetylase family protein [Pyrinomonadaceae bacterium]